MRISQDIFFYKKTEKSFTKGGGYGKLNRHSGKGREAEEKGMKKVKKKID
ncbi:hypothetical protein [Thomasclavelia cocleata]|nr:hypothetical protein [Thomasclavelia cocleata]